MKELLELYRERAGDPAFWAEPLNAITNASFLIAGGCGLWFAMSRNIHTPLTLLLIALAMMIGVGSFVFHTSVGRLTMWLDVIPIAIFQVVFLWLLCYEMLSYHTIATAIVVLLVLAASFMLMPVHDTLNGSLFYVPSLVAVLVLGGLWSRRTPQEPYLLIIAAGCFALALIARTVDWDVPWRVGSHFLWHLLNGVVVYCAIRAWVVHLVVQCTLQE